MQRTAALLCSQKKWLRRRRRSMEKVEEEERGTLREGQVREDIQRIGAVVLSRLKIF